MAEDVTPGMLHIVGTPLGNNEDISLRAMRILREVDLIACEERRIAAALLRRLDIRKELIEVNEHTEHGSAKEIVDLIRQGAQVALISDCGMPAFADPGMELVRLVWEERLPLDVAPGPTSVTTALALSGFDLRSFFFRGFLSPNSRERMRQLQELRSISVPIVLMDTPYRLTRLLRDAASVIGDGRVCCLACDLTMPRQRIERGTLSEVSGRFRDGDKYEFVLILDAPSRSASSARHSNRRRR
jgi:16S rRNA (cytidine1402-2'-O)-methyltransferase